MEPLNSNMAKNLDITLERVQKLIHRNFSESEVLRGKIEQIDQDQHRFMLSEIHGSRMIECRTFDDLTAFRAGALVVVSGTFKFYSRSSLRIYLLVDDIHAEDDYTTFASKLKKYDRLRRTLGRSRYQLAISQLGPSRPPSCIRNVGLIVLASETNAVDNFTTAFAERCNGKLFIFRLRSYEIDIAIEYLKKYHNIDLICILANNISATDSHALSTKTNIVYMINRTDTPFVVSITGSSPIAPLTDMLVNKRVQSIRGCIDFIQNIQARFRSKLLTGIAEGQKMFEGLIVQQKARVLEARQLVAEMSDPRFGDTAVIDKLTNIKQALTLLLHQEKQILFHVQNDIVSSLINDQRTLTFLSRMATAERVTFTEQPKAQVPETSHDSFFDVFSDPRVVPRRSTVTPISLTSDPNLTGSPISLTSDPNLTGSIQKIENKMDSFMNDDALSLDILRDHGQ